MKKLILSAVFVAFAGIAATKANDVKIPVIMTVQDSTTKTPVEIKDLPEPVKTTLKADPYKEWTPTTAWLVTNADKTQYFQVDVKKDEQIASLKIAADGKVIE